MQVSLLWASLILTFGIEACSGWVPIASFVRGVDYGSFRKSPVPRLGKLRVQQHLSSAEENVPGKPSSTPPPPPLSSSLVEYQKRTPIITDTNHIWKNHDTVVRLVSPELLGAGIIAGLIAIATSVSVAKSMDWSWVQTIDAVHVALQNPSVALDQVVAMVESMGPQGIVYFGIAYTIAEILAIPAIPLTASAGYLFGPVQGTLVVLWSASLAAAVSFLIGRTLLRDYVENVLQEYPKFAKLDRAIGKEGFKLMLLLRLSPIFPFALSNYLYGASSINFSAFFWGTLLGFAPGTMVYVCTGAFGKALTEGEGSNYPWYIYAGGLTVLAGLIKVLADTASRIVDEMEDDDETSKFTGDLKN